MKHAIKIAISLKNLLGKNSDLLSVGIQIWKSYDRETWMVTIDNIKPTIELIPLNTYFGYVELHEKKTQKPNRFYETLIRHIDEDKTVQKPEIICSA